MFVLAYCNPGPEGLQRGIAAAERYFQTAGADPVAAWRAAEALSFGAAYDRDALRHWYSAEECAILAIYGRFRHAPGTAALEWRADPEPAPEPVAAEPDGFPLGENPSW